MNRKQQLAILKQKGNAFIEAYGNAQLKRAEKVTVIKAFTTMITFLDADLKPVVQVSRPNKAKSIELPVLKTIHEPKDNLVIAKTPVHIKSDQTEKKSQATELLSGETTIIGTRSLKYKRVK
jgi:hypothetical protein